ncbi:MAG: hypothetical protein OXC84_13245, partial [Gammaproteobacteria bacterium]|nr:hypothetical protein [Gammaproteobacteria bacterium]
RGPVRLGATVDGVDSFSASDNSRYRFERHQFYSHSNTTVTIFAALAGNGSVGLVDEFRLVSSPAGQQ